MSSDFSAACRWRATSSRTCSGMMSAWKSARRSRQPISSRWIRGPASQTATGQASVSPMEAPLHVLAQEPLHQLFAMGIQETPQRIEHDVIHTPEPAGVDERLDLSEKLSRD